MVSSQRNNQNIYKMNLIILIFQTIKTFIWRAVLKITYCHFCYELR